MLQLRPYQLDIISDARQLMQRGCRTILIRAPTGSGKTVLTATMLQTAAMKGMPSLFINHRRELIKQSMRTFDKIQLRHGIIAAGFQKDPRPLVQIASVGTLVNRYAEIKEPKLIVWDECHHLAAAGWAKIFKAFPKAFHIGLTATPERLDGKGLGDFFERMIEGPSVSQLIDDGYLSTYKMFAPNIPGLQGVHTRMGDFVKSELAAVIDKPTITGNAIKEYKTHCDGKRGVAFCVSIEHSKHVAAQFNAAGIVAQHVDGDTDDGLRDQAIELFEQGIIKVLCNVDLFGEGFDIPAMECSILLRPTQSLALYLQQCGRALRPSPGKTHAVILDHAGNAMRHGLPDEDRQWSLEGRDIKKKDKEASDSVKVCPKCFAAQMPGKPYCEYCRHQFAVDARKVDEVDGELVEISKEDLKRQKKVEQGSADSLEALTELGRQRGYKRPAMWAKHIFNSRQLKKLRGG